jgi:hypothetical protein
MPSRGIPGRLAAWNAPAERSGTHSSSRTLSSSDMRARSKSARGSPVTDGTETAVLVATLRVVPCAETTAAVLAARQPTAATSATRAGDVRRPRRPLSLLTWAPPPPLELAERMK